MRTIKSIMTQVEYAFFRVLEEAGIYEYKENINIDHLSTLIFHDLLKYVEHDPAAKCCGYVLESYECFKAILYYRIANALYYCGVKSETETKFLKMKARKISEKAKAMTGVEIHPGARIGRGFVIDHGYGTVIGETAVIGDNCYILQGVILGARGIANNRRDQRHPSIGSNVEIGAFAKILGNINIGDNVFISPHSIVLEDVQANSRIKVLNQMQVVVNNSLHEIAIFGMRFIDGIFHIFGEQLASFTSAELLLVYSDEEITNITCQILEYADDELKISPLGNIERDPASLEILLKNSTNSLVSIKNNTTIKGLINAA